MHRCTRFVVVGMAAMATALVAAQPARAQTTTPTTISPTVAFPNRIVNGQNLGPTTRPVNLNPYGVNYLDCADDMTLQFPLTISGWVSGDTLEAWATASSDCTATTSRGVNSTAAVCWELSATAGIASITTATVSVRVRDIIGPQITPPYPAGLAATFARGENLGLKACAPTNQASFTAVPFTIWILAVQPGSGAIDGAYEYGSATPFTGDIVGPPPPTGVSMAAGDTLLAVNWMANLDSDTAAYDLYIDPIPGQEGSSASVLDATTLYCPPGVADASEGDGEGGASTVADAAGCFYINATSPPPITGACSADAVLSQGVVQQSGAGEAGVETVLEAGVDEDADLDATDVDAEVVSGPGGLSMIPSANMVGQGPAGVTVSDETTSSYIISGLQNGINYNVVVAAVDGSGNVGAPSTLVCGSPAPVNDFWNLYRQAGGQAGGSFCALEAVGHPVPAGAAGAMVACAGLLAMRRKRRSRP